MEVIKLVTKLNDAFEAIQLQNVANSNPASDYDIDLAEPFLGCEWGIPEWNTQRQTWRWLGPYGRSHLFVRFATETDHLIRIYVHTATSVEVLQSLTAFVNGVRCAHQGFDWGADGAASHWCVVERGLVADRQGTAKITWSLVPHREAAENEHAKTSAEVPTFARSIAFSRVVSEAYALPNVGESLPSSADLAPMPAEGEKREANAGSLLSGMATKLRSLFKSREPGHDNSVLRSVRHRRRGV